MSINFVAYYRVSTQKQGLYGLGMDAQQAAVSAYTSGRGVLLAAFTEVESGKKSDRPELHKAIRLAQKEKAMLIVAKLDRLARNVAFISNLMESGVEFTALDCPQANRFTIHVLAAVAEHEREMISARTKAALAIAKARGVRLGNPRLLARDPDAVGAAARAIREQAARRAHDLAPVIHGIQRAGVTTYAGIAEALNNRGIKSMRGGEWHATTARRLVLRLRQAGESFERLTR